MDENQEPKVHTIYFRINDQAFGIADLTTTEYHQLLYNDKAAWKFVQSIHNQENRHRNSDETINTLYRSVDNIDYTSVINKEQLLPSNKPTFRPHDPNEIVDSSLREISSNMTDETVPAVKVAQSTITPRIVHKSNVPAINEINSIKSTRKRSSVWMYFDKKDDQHALCTICNFKVKHYGGTSNLQAHLIRGHGLLCSGIFNNKRIISESENEKVATPDDPSPKRKKFSLMNKFSRIDEAFQKANSFAEGGSHSDKITAALMFMITKDKEPLAMVEREGFRHFMKVIVPLYRIPDRKTVTRLIDNRYMEAKEAYKLSLKRALSYTLTCDNWADCTFQIHSACNIAEIL